MEGTDVYKNECSNEVGEFLQELSFAVGFFQSTALTRSGFVAGETLMATFQQALLSESLAPSKIKKVKMQFSLMARRSLADVLQQQLG